MPVFLEKKLKKEYPGNPGAVYGTMNKLGYMKGNKETKKGVAAEKKHTMAKKMEHDISPKTQIDNYKKFKKQYHHE